MKTLFRIYSASCLIVLAFFAFFAVPWSLLPFSDGVNILTAGLVMLALAAFYVLYFYRKEGFDFGWFLANKGGFWVILLGAFGVAAIVCGVLLAIWPGLFVPAFEQGALPFGILIVSLFWLALIYIFGYLTIGMTARIVACFRIRKIADAVVNALITLVCLGLAVLFFSLFVEVLNDIAIRIAAAYQWNAIAIFAGAILIAGVVYGFWKDPSYHLSEDERSEELAEK